MKKYVTFTMAEDEALVLSLMFAMGAFALKRDLVGWADNVIALAALDEYLQKEENTTVEALVISISKKISSLAENMGG